MLNVGDMALQNWSDDSLKDHVKCMVIGHGHAPFRIAHLFLITSAIFADETTKRQVAK